MEYNLNSFKKSSLQLDDIIVSKVYKAQYIWSSTDKVPVYTYDAANDYKNVTTHCYILDNLKTKETTTFKGRLKGLIKFLNEEDLKYYRENDNKTIIS